MSGFFEEVKRRKVYRVAVAYVIVAGVIIQLGPGAVFRRGISQIGHPALVIVLLLIGFPIALILAWAYDVTPQGIKVTPRSSVQVAIDDATWRCSVVTGVIISAAAGFFLLPPRGRAQGRQVDRRSAVR